MLADDFHTHFFARTQITANAVLLHECTNTDAALWTRGIYHGDADILITHIHNGRRTRQIIDQPADLIALAWNLTYLIMSLRQIIQADTEIIFAVQLDFLCAHIAFHDGTEGLTIGWHDQVTVCIRDTLLQQHTAAALLFVDDRNMHAFSRKQEVTALMQFPVDVIYMLTAAQLTQLIMLVGQIAQADAEIIAGMQFIYLMTVLALEQHTIYGIRIRHHDTVSIPYAFFNRYNALPLFTVDDVDIFIITSQCKAGTLAAFPVDAVADIPVFIDLTDFIASLHQIIEIYTEVIACTQAVGAAEALSL